MRKIWIMLACVFGTLACAWVLQTLYIVNYDPVRAFEVQSTPSPKPRATKAVAAATPTPTLSPEEALMMQADTNFMKDRVNILLIGFDQSPEREEEGSIVYRNKKNNYRSDVLLLCAVNFADKSVHLISIPRDTYAQIYNTRGRWKINAAFAKGGAVEGDGFTYATKTVELLFGVPVTYYAGVNMEGLKSLVDTMGGVDYDVDLTIKLNGRVLEPGYQHLTGQQVLDYCRARKGISTDLGRNDRQQRMLLAVFNQLQRQNRLTLLPQLYASMQDDIYTNLNAAQIAALATFALNLNDTSFKRTTLAGEYVSNVYHASYYVLRNKELAKLVMNEFGITVKRDKKYDLATVKRDKAAAEAKKAAEQLEIVAAMLTLPADTTGSYSAKLLEEARASANILQTAIDEGASETEINRLRGIYMVDVAAVLHDNQIDSGVPEAFYTLIK
ncbi:MAG: LCP family protein [Clostridia bacterium]